MGLAAVNPFIGPAERADSCFNVLYKPEGKPLLRLPGMAADRAVLAYRRQCSVKFCHFVF
jgi:hypothetical protein